MPRLVMLPILLLALLGATSAWGRPGPTTRIYELTIDGQTFEVAEGLPRTVTLKSGTSHRVHIRPKTTQKLRVGAWNFEYPSTFNFERDEDGDIMLIDGGGIGLTVVDSATGNAAFQRGVFDETMKEFRRMQGAGAAKRPEATGPTARKQGTAEVLHGSLEYSDEDDGRQFMEVAVLRAPRGQCLIVILTCEKGQILKGRAAFKTVLTSMVVP